MEISVVVTTEKGDIWATTFDSEDARPIKGYSTCLKAELEKVLNALDVAKEHVKGQISAANDID